MRLSLKYAFVSKWNCITPVFVSEELCKVLKLPSFVKCTLTKMHLKHFMLLFHITCIAGFYNVFVFTADVYDVSSLVSNLFSDNSVSIANSNIIGSICSV